MPLAMCIYKYTDLISKMMDDDNDDGDDKCQQHWQSQNIISMG